jgi:hypothetical protein
VTKSLLAWSTPLSTWLLVGVIVLRRCREWPNGRMVAMKEGLAEVETRRDLHLEIIDYGEHGGFPMSDIISSQLIGPSHVRLYNPR